MFEECTTLAQLNAARVQAIQTANQVEVNNAYNKRRAEIIATKTVYTQLTPIEARKVEMPIMSCVPLIGRSKERGCITLTEKGFLY